MNHTPGPWRIEDDEIRGSDTVHTNGRARNSLGISSASYSDCVCTVYGWMDLEHPKGNAKFIVTACNAHEGLVGILQKLSSLAPSNEGLGGHAPLSAFIQLASEARKVLTTIEKGA